MEIWGAGDSSGCTEGSLGSTLEPSSSCLSHRVLACTWPAPRKPGLRSGVTPRGQLGGGGPRSPGLHPPSSAPSGDSLHREPSCSPLHPLTMVSSPSCLSSARCPAGPPRPPQCPGGPWPPTKSQAQSHCSSGPRPVTGAGPEHLRSDPPSPKGGVCVHAVDTQVWPGGSAHRPRTRWAAQPETPGR